MSAALRAYLPHTFPSLAEEQDLVDMEWSAILGFSKGIVSTFTFCLAHHSFHVDF